MTTWRDDVWFFDTEVLPHDWLFCATNEREQISVHNDTQLLKAFFDTRKPFLCGYNSKHYDMYIIKAILSSGSPEDVKAVSDAIVVDGRQGWEIDMGWVSIPESFDLMLDLPTMPSLKLIEGNLKMDICESEVNFTTERPTLSQWKELEEYCWHDVNALVPLYTARKDYLNAKETLAEMMGLEVKKALNMTNAKLTAQFLGASRVEHTDERAYVYPDNIDRSRIPSEVFEFFNRLPHSDIPLDVLFGREGIPDEDGKIVKSRNPYRALNINIAGCPHVLGWGGVHSALVNYYEKSTATRTILNYDVQSYYPSLMIVNGYTSRNIPDASVFEEVYHKRISAKKTGDKKTADALKLILNTTYGASNNQYNDLYDPLMAHSVCISGQLYLVQLINMLNTSVPSFTLIQGNTDGIMFSVDNEYIVQVRAVVEQWETLTHFKMEETKIESVLQRDVNNYVMREVDGEIKVKGGVVSDYKGGDFKHNSLSIVCKAVVDNLLDNVEIEKTINDCTDIFAFQMVVKAGGSYDTVVHSTGVGDVEVNRVNRIFASKDQRVGAVYKIKSDGRRDKVANCPLHAIVDNSGVISIDKIDTKWYIELAQKRAREFRGDKSMGSEEELEVIIDDDDSKLAKPIIKTVAKEKKAGGKVEVTPFKVKLFNLARDIGESAKSLVKDGYNPSQSYEYVKASQYKTMLRIAVARNELIMKIDDMVCQPIDVLKSEKMTLTQYHGVLTLIDTTSEEKMTYMIWSQGADNLDKGLSKAKTLAIKDFVKSNFLVSDAEDDPEADTASKSASAKKFVTPTESDKKVKEVMKDSTMANVESVEKLKDIITRIREKSGDATYGDKVMGELLSGPITSARETVLLTKLEIKGGEYGLEI